MSSPVGPGIALLPGSSLGILSIVALSVLQV